MTSDRITDKIEQKMEVDGQTVYKLGQLQNFWFCDGYPETWGLNRQVDESV